MNEVTIQWDKQHNFNNKYYEYDNDFNIDLINEKYKEIIKGERTVFRRVVTLDSLNER